MVRRPSKRALERGLRAATNLIRFGYRPREPDAGRRDVFKEEL
jgi:hypothetical protein